ncbi:unnamed protein product [Schistosoma margrebowiei]|uniref:Uncharacterized protein n=1 Tax=Schistosoma margrebowiei TaxID=48269 RepID=A0A183N084_9TREM|nr:unnamed protein product [Schistosoma margrebowiei]
MKTSTSEGKHGIQWTSWMQSDNLDFADELALLSQSQQRMQEMTNSVAAASAAVACTDPITIGGENLEDVKTFTYLGSIIDDHGGSDTDVKARIGLTRAAYLQLRNIWNSKQLLTNTEQGVPVILRELVLPDGFDPASPSFTVRDVTTVLCGRKPTSCKTEM